MKTKPIDVTEAKRIARKWIGKFGAAFHPDTPGDDYVRTDSGERSLTDGEAAEYDADMKRLLSIETDDPYEVCMDVLGL